jgi:hypothetical protein
MTYSITYKECSAAQRRQQALPGRQDEAWHGSQGAPLSPTWSVQNAVAREGLHMKAHYILVVAAAGAAAYVNCSDCLQPALHSPSDHDARHAGAAESEAAASLLAPTCHQQAQHTGL